MKGILILKILIIEDNQDFVHLLTAIIHLAIKNTDIIYAKTSEEAIGKITNHEVDLIISDFYFPGNFPSILPAIQQEKRLFILQSSCPECVKIYDKNLQIDAICKNREDFTAKMIEHLKALNVRFSKI